jgi:hypothetical protein
MPTGGKGAAWFPAPLVVRLCGLHRVLSGPTDTLYSGNG